MARRHAAASGVALGVLVLLLAPPSCLTGERPTCTAGCLGRRGNLEENLGPNGTFTGFCALELRVHTVSPLVSITAEAAQ
jgi:hypothetical protein